MAVYRTSEVAALIGIHPNTVRLYEQWELIPKPERLPNGYRIFTEFHIEQFRLARLAFQVEVLQNGLRRKIVQMIKASAQKDFDTALSLTREYQTQLCQERKNAEEAIRIVQQLLSGNNRNTEHTADTGPVVTAGETAPVWKRKEVSESLGISMDALRNWEMNGLLTVKRKQNGYRIYTEHDIKQLKVIRSLRCANYSLEAILRMLRQVSRNPDADIRKALNTPEQDAEIITVCDKLIVSLSAAEANAAELIQRLQQMKNRFS